MKKIALILSLIPTLVFAQNPLSDRSSKSDVATPKDFEYETIDGRNSSTPNQISPMNLSNLDLAKSDNTVKYNLKYDEEIGLPIWLDVHAPLNDEGRPTKVTDPNFTAAQVIKDLPTLFGWNEHASLNRYKTISDDLNMEHHRYQQYYKGVKVKGGEFILHSVFGNTQFASGRIYPSIDLNVTPTISLSDAIHVAEEKGSSMHKGHQDDNHSIDLPFSLEPVGELMIDFTLVPGMLKPTLVYRIEVRPTQLHYYSVLVDANTGEILKTLDQLCSIDGPKTASATDANGVSRTLNTYQVGSTYYLIDATKSMFNLGQSNLPDDPVGAVWTIDANNTAASSFTHVSSSNNSWSDATSVSAHYNGGLAFDYFKNTHARNAINGSGGTIVSIVNVADQGGGSMENAYWNGQAMFYGNGGTVFYPLAGALDVAGHELTHGVVGNTANLEYEGQSGAINESMADVFGAMIDRDDWKMGEDIVRPGQFPGGALRDLQDPHNGGNSLSDRGYQPERMAEYFTGSADNYGVHINSGIVNRAFYLAATASGMSKLKAEKIWYRALVQYLTKNSQFLDLRYACVQAAGDLYGTTEEDAVKAAFDTVEIYDPNGGSGGGSTGGGGGSDLPSNPGDEFVVSVDIDAANNNTFYKSTTVPDGWKALSTTSPKRKATITDDGSIMYYISSSTEAMYSILLESPFTEQQVHAGPWDNVAVSKDGSLIAAISTQVDSAIWVYSFDKGAWREYRLYNPTYSDGVNGGNVLYADAIEFDNTGENILYDARNIIKNASGTDIDYWDLGVIRVWDNDADNWGDGKVEKLFTQLGDGISIGNATYSKNSPSVIAFDYIDGNNNSYAVLGANINTGDVQTIFTNAVLGYPNYSTDDDQVIFNAQDGSGNNLIGKIAVGSDKITGSGTASGFIGSATLGVWYANGDRNLESDKKDILSFAFPALTGQPEGTIVGSTITVEVPTSANLNGLVPTFTHSEESTVSVSNAIQTSGVNSQNFTNDVIYKVTAQDGSSKNYIVKVNRSAGINTFAQSILIFPNPATDRLEVRSPFAVEAVSVQTLDGKMIKYEKGTVLSLEGLSTGLYLLKIDTEHGIITKKFNKI